MKEASSVRDEFDRATVRRVVVEALFEGKRAGPVRGAVGDDALLGQGGLEVGSLPLLHAFVHIEKALGLQFDDFSVANSKLETVGDLVRFVDDALRTKTGVATHGER